jgi:hypothetical protein
MDAVSGSEGPASGGPGGARASGGGAGRQAASPSFGSLSGLGEGEQSPLMASPDWPSLDRDTSRGGSGWSRGGLDAPAAREIQEVRVAAALSRSPGGASGGGGGGGAGAEARAPGARRLSWASTAASLSPPPAAAPEDPAGARGGGGDGGSGGWSVASSAGVQLPTARRKGVLERSKVRAAAPRARARSPAAAPRGARASQGPRPRWYRGSRRVTRA